MMPEIVFSIELKADTYTCLMFRLPYAPTSWPLCLTITLRVMAPLSEPALQVMCSLAQPDQGISAPVARNFPCVNRRAHPLGPFGRLIVSGLNGFRSRSMDGAGPMPTGRLTPARGFTDMNVVVWKLAAGLAGSGSGAAFTFSSSGVDARGGELEKQVYCFRCSASALPPGRGCASVPALGSLCPASAGSIVGFGALNGTTGGAGFIACREAAA